jgi:hypothetical protein
MSVELVDPGDADRLTTGATVRTLDVQVESTGWASADAMIDEWGRQSFPASDPPSNW